MSKRKTKSIGISGSERQRLMLERYQLLLSKDDFASLQAGLQLPLYPALRVNSLKAELLVDLPAWAKYYDWQTQPVDFCPSGVQITQSRVPISQTIEHRMGFYYIQDAASMLPVELFGFNNEPGISLDMAASPGGKTTHLSSRMHDRGLVIANDSNRSRITALRLVLQTWGSANAAVTCFPGERFGGWFPDLFDHILLDAPCSMENLRSTANHPMRPISDKERDNLAARQLNLLISAFRALKPGGQLVYSTCTLSPVEDEAVLDGLLRIFPGNARVMNVSEQLSLPASGLAGEGERAYDPTVRNSLRLWPHIYGTSGFFAARLTKESAITPIPRGHNPYRSFSTSRYEPLHRVKVSYLSQFFQEFFGFNLSGVLNKQNLSLWTFNKRIFALPEAFFNSFPDMPFESLGLPVGDETPDGFSPSHEWVARFGRTFTSGIVCLEEEVVAAWLRGEDIPLPRIVIKPGSTVVVEDRAGRLLGRGKVTAQRLKNLLPRRLAV
jgi:16S rRNA (cytosine1407-C5)-methyltransferase